MECAYWLLLVKAIVYRMEPDSVQYCTSTSCDKLFANNWQYALILEMDVHHGVLEFRRAVLPLHSTEGLEKVWIIRNRRKVRWWGLACIKGKLQIAEF